jgi:hypothetical protein
MKVYILMDAYEPIIEGIYANIEDFEVDMTNRYIKYSQNQYKSLENFLKDMKEHLEEHEVMENVKIEEFEKDVPVTKEEREWLNQYDKDVAKDSVPDESFGCWCSCRSYEDFQRAFNIKCREIESNWKEIEKKVGKK